HGLIQHLPVAAMYEDQRFGIRLCRRIDIKTFAGETAIRNIADHRGLPFCFTAPYFPLTSVKSMFGHIEPVIVLPVEPVLVVVFIDHHGNDIAVFYFSKTAFSDSFSELNTSL